MDDAETDGSLLPAVEGVSYKEAKSRETEALARIGLQEQESVLNRRLSGGTKRKVLVAKVLASDADILFLDEPTTGPDPISRRELWRFLGELAKDRFLTLTTRYLEEAEQLATTIGIMHRGRMVGLGSLEQLRSEVRYQYSVMVSAGSKLPKVADGSVAQGRSGEAQLPTNESEAYSLSRQLLEKGTKYSVNRISLDDVFFHLVNRYDREANPVESWGRQILASCL